MASQKYKNHAYANLFPMMTEAELDALAADIEENGLRQPIVLFNDEILDGRNRYKACEKAKAKPEFTTYEGDDPLGMVISLNVQRRDMTAAQRAIVGAKAANMGEGRPKKTSTDGTSLTIENAARVFKVGVRQVKEAKAILSDAPDLAEQVESRTMSLEGAYSALQSRRSEATKKAKDAERIAEYTDAISNGEITIEEALRKIQEEADERKEKAVAEADARQQWLKKFVEMAQWIEVFASEKSDEALAWYTLPDSVGLYDHGMTAKRVTGLVKTLERVRVNTFGGKK